MEILKVIFHVDEMDKWDLTIGNVKNFVLARPDANVEVLANGEAVKAYSLNGTHIDELEDLIKLGVEFYACNNALNLFRINLGEISSQIGVVPAGVVYLAEKQMEGYAYIRP